MQGTSNRWLMWYSVFVYLLYYSFSCTLLFSCKLLLIVFSFVLIFKSPACLLTLGAQQFWNILHCLWQCFGYRHVKQPRRLILEIICVYIISVTVGWPNSCTPPESDSPWLTYDPAILSSGNIQDGMSCCIYITLCSSHWHPHPHPHHMLLILSTCVECLPFVCFALIRIPHVGWHLSLHVAKTDWLWRSLVFVDHCAVFWDTS